jgi:hypothetical protein
MYQRLSKKDVIFPSTVRGNHGVVPPKLAYFPGRVIAEVGAESSIFLAGISQLRDFYRMSKTKDPVEVVSKPLFAANVYYNMESVMIADGARINRPEARAVIIHILSFTRKWP